MWRTLMLSFLAVFWLVAAPVHRCEPVDAPAVHLRPAPSFLHHRLDNGSVADDQTLSAAPRPADHHRQKQAIVGVLPPLHVASTTAAPADLRVYRLVDLSLPALRRPPRRT